MTRAFVKPLPVLYACQGCPQFGQGARDVGRLLERTGRAQLVWLGDPASPSLGERYPIYSLDGCDRGCARQWLRDRGIEPEHSFALG